MSSVSSGEQVHALATYPIIPKSDLEVKEQLGVGTYGSVHKGIWKNGDKSITVALKKVFMLEKEVDILSQVRHRNIIQFYGVSHANPDFYIVTDYAENGSLYEYLHNVSADVTFDHIIRWAIQIAHGVHYLHYEAPTTIVHRDLKSKNVVLGPQYVCKLCDFGTSKDLTRSWTEPSWGGTAAWMSPEIINQKEGITTATDIWSFGVCLWELISREVPYKGLTEFKIYSVISQYGSRLVIPETCPSPLANLLRDCWHVNPRERADMREILLLLQQMEENNELRQECADFVEQKPDWMHEIQQQLRGLEELKMDLARQKEDLERREQLLKQRENSHRNFLHMIEYMKWNNVVEWNEDCVCGWIQHFLASSVPDMSMEVVDRLLSCVLQYEISGARLLKVTERDLENLGIESDTIRRGICAKIDELRVANVDYVNYPSLQMSALMDARSKLEKANATFNSCIVLHVGMYHRELKPEEGSSTFRFKVFVDSDWEASPSDSMPPAIHDSATVIKEVSISITTANRWVLLDTVRCVCPPFGYLEWVDVDLEDLEASNSLPLTVTCAITYTDQVVQPRSTRLNVNIDEFTSPRTLSTKHIPLRVRTVTTEASLSRISSTMFGGFDKTPSSGNLQGVWRRRAVSFGTKTVSTASAAEFLARPAWSEIAASLRARSPPHYSKSMPNGDAAVVNSNSVLKDPGTLSVLNNNSVSKDSGVYSGDTSPQPSHMPKRSLPNNNGYRYDRRRSQAISIPSQVQRQARKTSENEVDCRTPEIRPSFYVNSTSPSESPLQLTPQDQRLDPLITANGEMKKLAINGQSPRRCSSYGRNLGSVATPTASQEETPAASEKLRRRPRRNRKAASYLKGPTASEPTLPPRSPDPAAGAANQGVGKCSQKVYGGYNKWRWKV